MAGSVNKAIIVGHLGRDPDLRSTQSGDQIANLSVATAERWRDKAGEMQDRTEWHKVTVMVPKLAEICGRYLKKGSKIYVEGKIQTRKWTDKAGQERLSTEIVVSAFSGQLVILSDAATRQDAKTYEATKKPAHHADAPAVDDLDDEIPF